MDKIVYLRNKLLDLRVVFFTLFVVYFVMYNASQSNVTPPTPAAAIYVQQSVSIDWGGYNLTTASSRAKSCTNISFTTAASLTTAMYITNTNFVSGRDPGDGIANNAEIHTRNNTGYDFGSQSMFGYADLTSPNSYTCKPDGVSGSTITFGALSFTTDSVFAVDFYKTFREEPLQFCIGYT